LVVDVAVWVKPEQGSQVEALVIHEAGELTRDGVQRCVRCGYVLTDYRHTLVVAGSPALGGWEVGAFVEVVKGAGNPRYSGITEVPPDCEVVQ
jgi:hypothetical protein